MRFILDSMLGRLARWLRILGYDSQYLKYISDSHLLSQAKHESRILLTSDAQLYRTAISKGISCFLISTQNESERLAHLAYRFNLNLKFDSSKSKCPLCGSNIEPVQKQKIRTKVPPATLKLYETFWLCTNISCAKVYWQGSHWKKIEQTLETARNILDNKKNNRTRQYGEDSPKPRKRRSTGPASKTGHHELPRKTPNNQTPDRNR